MCWTNYIAIPLVLKKPLRVYKVGTSSIFCGFISLYRDFMYHESQTMPTVKINPEFIRCPPIFGPQDELWSYDNFYIYEIENIEGLYCVKNFKIVDLCYIRGKTKLNFNGITEFEGKAFDFDTELVILKLERGV